MSLQNPEPQNVYPVAYSPTPGTIGPVPAPEPATILAWTSVIAGLASDNASAANTRRPDPNRGGRIRPFCDGIAIAAGLEPQIQPLAIN